VYVIRFFLGLLLGIIAGVAGTAYFFSMSGGDYLLVSSARVLRLEEDLRRVVQEREQITRKLEEATGVIENITTRFTDLERRFHTLETISNQAPGQRTPEEPPDHTPEASSSPAAP
jgi:hypothetical protein